MTVKISKNSWHYRYVRFLRDPVPGDTGNPFRGHRKEPNINGFCAYFWQIVFSPVQLVAMGCMGLVIGAVFVVSYPFLWLGFKIKDWREDRKHDIALGKREPSPVGTFVRSRKARVCPRVEVLS